ncbi:MAG: phage major capsid protein [Roseovarius sp.]|nr:phage major capsid protein [Roseovarius sp.]
MLSGLVGKVRVPRLAGGATSEWLPEAGAVSDSAPSFETVALSPHTIAASVPMTRRLLIQSTPEIEVVIRNELVQRVALGIDAAALNGDASDNAPTGLRELIVGSATDWTADAAPTHKEIVALETAVASATADRGNLAYLYGAAMSGHLKTTALDTGSGAFLENPDGTVNGHRRVITNRAGRRRVFRQLVGPDSRHVVGARPSRRHRDAGVQRRGGAACLPGCRRWGAPPRELRAGPDCPPVTASR